MEKEKQQILFLAMLIVGIIGVIVYFNYDQLKPRAILGSDIDLPKAELQIDIEGAKNLFKREDYKGLKEYGVVPVRPMGLGNDRPFVTSVAGGDEEQ